MRNSTTIANALTEASYQKKSEFVTLDTKNENPEAETLP